MAADRDTLEQQVVDLQSQLAFQEDAISSLDAALARQQQEILVLQKQLEMLRQRQQELAALDEAGPDRAPPMEKPPHY